VLVLVALSLESGRLFKSFKEEVKTQVLEGELDIGENGCHDSCKIPSPQLREEQSRR